ncbi:leucyl aminopeptidase [Frigoriglobus tundricola]|uniref:Probable cytosol aminopeptidase n=1 Tax=Frigoriglobus tundricola TaxID=2774151 RepID=A0A6M5Z3G0_9BACT|nr:leucyl aminopeptidase [Frigoriglobus tundricola]QJX00948.1 Cytosol aminopeptidase PepA [Frigoriglobus tundricola]
MLNIPSTQFNTSIEAPATVPADWLALGVWADEPDTGPVAGLVSELRERGDFSAKHLELVPIFNPAGVAAQRLLLVGLGQRAGANRAALHAAAAAAARHVTGKKVGTVAFSVPAPEFTLAVGVGFAQGCQGPGVRKTSPTRFAPGHVLLLGGNAADLPRVRAEARALWLARELVNAPPCDLYPETFAVVAADAGRATGFDVEVWDESRLAAERMGSLLAVARGSARPARLALLRYTGDPGGPVLGLVGKGVTFDSGGLSLKPTDGMVDMKCDMAGAAAVLAGTQAVAELKLPVNVLGVLALVENMPGGKAMMLGDVLKARNGKTIEVLNTDAEGRLILADALSFAAEHTDRLVDFATLTGACMVALGTETAGLMTNDGEWGETVLGAVTRAGERAWKLPLDASYDGLIKSKVADMRNTGGGRWGGAIAGGKFLEQFVGQAKWVHLDIAGPAFAESESAALDAGGTGCMVRSIVEMARTFSGERSG